MRTPRFLTVVSSGLLATSLLCLGGNSSAQTVTGPAPPEVGTVVEDFKLPGLDNESVELSKLAEAGPVVVIVLRGYPGYQCPACTAQFASFGEHAKEFAALNATVLFIYPGEEKQLEKRAQEFLKAKKLEPPFTMALDPDFKLTKALGVRWTAPGETAYPSTFVLDQDRKVKYAKISHEHGDRAEAKDVLAVLRGK